MSPFRGIALKLTSVFLFMVMASLVKAGSAEVPAGQAVFFRSFFALPIIVGWLAIRRELRSGFHVQSVTRHIWRGAIGVSAMGCGFAALALLPLPEVTAIGYAAPLLTVFFAAIMLGERVRLFRISAVVLGMVGVLVVLWPRLTASEGFGGDMAILGVGLTLMSAVLRALAHIQIRRMVATETTSAIVFWFSMTSTVLSLVTLPFGWVVPTAGTAAMLILAGLLGGVAQILMTMSYRHGEAALLAPFDYASILFALVIGYFVFNEAPTVPMLVGSAIVVMAGVMIIWRERQLGLKRGKARAGLTPQG